MTLYLTFAEIEAGRLDLGDSLTVSRTAAAQPATRLGPVEDEKISVEQAIAAVIVRSANDAAVVLGERISRPEGALSKRLRTDASPLGMATPPHRPPRRPPRARPT